MDKFNDWASGLVKVEFEKWLIALAEKIKAAGAKQEQERILTKLAKWGMENLDIRTLELLDYFVSDLIEEE